jgi:hypothetical protein
MDETNESPQSEAPEYLSPRQEDLVEELLDIVKEHGKFGWGIDSEGSHYTPAELNPFKAEGLICANCAFYAKDSKSCSIVDGVLEPEAICKFWVVENEDLGIPDFEQPFDPEEMNEEEDESESSAAGKYSGISFSPPAGVKSAARRGLALHEKGLSGNGLESATVLWARKYTKGQPVSPSRARMGNRFFGRNARFAKAPKDSPAWVSWLLWGGAAGRAWFARLVRQMDAADKKSSASMRGGFRLAETVNTNNPFIKEIEVVLTDFEPNNNGEGIPKSEIENVIKTSRHTPIKIAASSSSYGGHTGAHPVGSIVEAFVDTYEGREVIKAKAFIWKDEYPAVYDLLKSQASEGKFIGTSWEIYYSSADEVDGVRWLKDVTFAGTCIVDNPAYGSRTPMLSVAEQKEKEQMEELQKEIEQLKAALTQKEAAENELRVKIQEYEEAERRAKAEARRNEVITKISSFFSESELAEKVEFYLSFEDSILDKLISDLQKTQPAKTSSESNKAPVIPEPSGNSVNLNDPKVLAAALKQSLKGSK